MKLTLNKQELEGFLPEDATLGEALAMVQEQRITDDEVLAGIWVDGEPLTAERLSIWKDHSVHEFSEASIEAPGRKTFAMEGLHTLAEKLQQSTPQRDQIVDHITQGRPQDGLTELNDYLRIWTAIPQSLASVGRMLDLDLEAIEYHRDQSDPESVQTVGALIEQLSEQLREVKSALEAGDYILLGDILDYEFPDLTSDWTQMLNQLAQHFDTPN